MNRFTKFEKYKVNSYDSGSYLLNRAIGKCNGYPQGSIVEIYGWPGAGKTLLTYLAISQAQKQYPNRPCLLIDAENTFQFQQEWAEQFGLDVENLYVEKVSSAEEAFDVLEEAVLGEVEKDKKGKPLKIVTPNDFGCIVVDSVSQLVPLAEIEARMDESTRQGAQAGVMGKGLRKLQAALSFAKSNTTVFFINQVRTAPTMYGNPETRSGGNALPFYATLIIKVTKDNKSIERDSKGKILSHDILVKIEKNKAGEIPERPIRFKINYDGTGVDNDLELFDVGLMTGAIQKHGSYYSFKNKDGSEDIEIGRFYARKIKYIFEQFPDRKKQLLALVASNDIYTEDLTEDELNESYEESKKEEASKIEKKPKTPKVTKKTKQVKKGGKK